jgi:hypothetical protein
MLRPQNTARSGTGDVSVKAGLGFGLTANEAARSLDAVVEAEIRPAYAPAAERNMRRQR